MNTFYVVYDTSDGTFLIKNNEDLWWVDQFEGLCAMLPDKIRSIYHDFDPLICRDGGGNVVVAPARIRGGVSGLPILSDINFLEAMFLGEFLESEL